MNGRSYQLFPASRAAGPRRVIHIAAICFLLLLSLAVFVALAATPGAQETHPPLLVIISIDGLKPEYITEAGAHGVKAPNLRTLMTEGAYAAGVQGVIPTVTYPSHTTLVTGVWPSKHGILSNTIFDPFEKNKQAWYWYAEEIRVPTLYDAAMQSGRTTASLQWPVTVGAHITWNIPEFWRAGTEEDIKLLRVVSTPGLLAEIARDIGEYRGGIDTTIAGDESRGRTAVWVLEKKRPLLLLLHLTALDHEEHESGPFSAESIATLEKLDAIIGQVREAAEKLAPAATYFAVVSDHGFARVDRQLNLFPAFRDAKLISLGEKGKVADWKAMPWVTGGSAAIVLKDPHDGATLRSARELLSKLAADPANGIGQVLEAKELHERGGYPNASFFVSLKPGWRTGGGFDSPLLSKIKVAGTHGESPDEPQLRASFFLAGPNVPRGKNLGLIDMRDIAPSLAKLAGLSLPSSDGKPLLP